MTPATLSRLKQAGLSPQAVEILVQAALREDEAHYDVTSRATIDAAMKGTADVRSREGGVVAGLAVAIAVLDVGTHGSAEILHAHADGTVVAPGEVVLTVSASLRELLGAERTMLNLVCHLSGIATATSRWVAAVAGTGAAIRDTRKTTPGLRALEKWAVRCGGGVNHRMSLADAALIKDNHVVAAGGVEEAFALVRQHFPDIDLEVECDTVDQVRRVVKAGASLVLLDNMSVEELRESVQACREAGVRTEASGGLSLDRAAEVAGTGVDFLSIGALTHSSPVLDLGLDLRSS